MAKEWSFPQVRNHVSSAAVDTGPAISPNASTDRHSMNPATEKCTCEFCTGSTSNGPSISGWYTMDHQNWDRRPQGGTYTNNQGQSVSDPRVASLPQDFPVLSQTQFAAPGPEVQDPNNPAPRKAAVNTPQPLAAVQPEQPRQDPAISDARGLRRLADRYVNNPDSVIGMVHLEPGSSGGFQVIIILEVADLL
ncbi:hypothetical protein EI94DRAFT_1801433 [Lactarius quietus]|nr:hypothetical protein EI94DRAFT_1801433 [Lactarius quietus]